MALWWSPNMDLERVLVSKIVFTGQIEEVLARSITEDHFFDDECREMYRYLVDFTRRYKSCPSLDTVKHDRPDFEWIQTQESIEWVVDRFSVQVKRKLANDMLEELARAADDRDRAENIDLEFLEVTNSLLRALPTGRVERFSEAESRIAGYEERKASGKPIGIPYGFPTLDTKLGGVFKHELITVLGFTNIGKSTLLRVFAHNMWLKRYTPLIFSLEMDADEIFRAFDAMDAGLDYQKLKQLKLDDEQMGRWKVRAKDIVNWKSDIPVIDTMFHLTPEQIYAEILRHKPDIALIDYIGLMRSSQVNRGNIQRYQVIGDIIQDLKVTARRLKTPIIIAAQTNRGGRDGAEIDNVADSIHIAQTSDTVIGLHQSDEMYRDHEMEIRVVKSRTGPRPKLKAIWNYETQQFRETNLLDFMKRSQNGAVK
jgi:replicative DNA helicase